MVLPASMIGTGPIKRPASSMHDDYTSWETAPSMGIPMRTSLHLPFTHYAMICLDNMGRLKVVESPSIQEQNGTIFTPEVRQRFLEILGTKIGYQRPMIRRTPSAIGNPCSHSDHYWGSSPDRQVKRRRSANDQAKLADPMEELPLYSTDMAPLEIGDTAKVMAYYQSALKHFQQLNCRQIAKAFIKFIEPRKQVKHPYNGGRPPAGAPPGEKGDPEKTKPEWWPAGIIHKEPDHLKKEDRIVLLIHIIRKLGKYNITPDKLREVAHDTKRQFKPQEKIEILDEVFRVRRLEERYERGEVDHNAVVYVVNRDANPKNDKDSDSLNDEPEQKLDTEDTESEDDRLLTPVSSTQQSPGTLTPSVDPMGMVAPSRPMHISDDRNQFFHMTPSLSFDQSRQDRPYYPSAEYPDDFTAHILKTPVSSAMVSPHEQPQAFDYLSQSPFPASTAEEQISHHRQALPVPTSHYDTWAPTFRQNIFGSVDYSAPSQTLPQPGLGYQMPGTPASHTLAHGLPEACRPKETDLDTMGLKAPPFRTGSLSHPHIISPHVSHPGSS